MNSTSTVTLSAIGYVPWAPHLNDITANTKLIDAFTLLCLERLRPCLTLVVEETADYLFSLSMSARLDSANQAKCYEAFLTLQRGSNSTVEQICAFVQRGFDVIETGNLAYDETTDGPQTEALALVDLEEFEDTLAIEKIIKVGTERFWVQLESLIFRLANLLDIDPEDVDLPVSPRILCSGYRQALRGMGFPRGFLVDADSAFVRNLLPELGSIYEALNERLKSEGLMPAIEDELKLTGSRLLMRVARPASNLDVETSDQPAIEVVIAGRATLSGASNNARFLHDDDWINTVSVDVASATRSLPAFRREHVRESVATDSQLEASGGTSGFLPRRLLSPSRDEAALNRLLSSTTDLLQNRPINSLEIESENRRVARALGLLRTENTTERHTYHDLMDRTGLTIQPIVRERLKEAFGISKQLVDYLWHRLSPLKSEEIVFAKLEICFLELSLIDPNFLVDGDHPGRALVDRITDLATLFPRGDASFLNSFVSVLSALVTHFDSSTSMLVTANSSLSDLSLQLIEQQRQNRQRLVARENANDKIDSARIVVIEILDSAFERESLAQCLIDLICSGFVHRWVVDLLKGEVRQKIEGEVAIIQRINEASVKSEAYDAHLRDLDAILGPESERASEVNDAYNALRTADCALGQAPKNWGLAVDLTPDEVTLALHGRARLKRVTNTIQNLPIDTWFKQLTTRDYRYLQIVWVNRHGTRFVLTDERGLKQCDLSILQLAVQFERSLRRLSTLERLSLVEQTLFSKLTAVQTDVSERFLSINSDAASRIAHEIERRLRRVRRAGSAEVLVSFDLPADRAPRELETALHDRNLSSATVIMLSKTRGCVFLASEPEFLYQLIRDIYGSSETYTFLSCTLTEATSSNTEAILAATLTPQSKKAPERDAYPDATVTSRGFDYAIEEALTRISETSGTLRLRTVLRVCVADPTSIETAFLVQQVDFANTDKLLPPDLQQRDLKIASNLSDIREACSLLRTFEDQRLSVPHLLLKLSGDTCLHAGSLDRILSLISEYTVGTSQLSFLITDSLQLRESKICQRLTQALKSIGCHIVIENYTPERGHADTVNDLNPTDITIDEAFWERAAQHEPWSIVLPQLIADTHHILGQSVTVRNPKATRSIETSGVDYIERHSDVLVSPSELIASLGAESH